MAAEPRVVIGPYQENVSLRDLFKSRTTNEDDWIHRVLRHNNVETSVFLTQDWPELANDWDSNYVGVLVSENEAKLLENDLPLRDTVLKIQSKKDFIAGPDSEERQKTAIEIARVKAEEGLLKPVEDATPGEIDSALAVIGAEDPTKVLVISEDRELVLHPVLKEASVWDPYRHLDLVKECFEDGEAFPARRINELVNACGGVVSFLLTLQEAKKELRVKYGKEYCNSEKISFPFGMPEQQMEDLYENYGQHLLKSRGIDLDTHKSYVSYYMKFLEYDEKQPLPKEGIFITASEHNRRFIKVTELDLAREKAGEAFDLYHFDTASGFYNPQDERASKTLADLWKNPDNSYFKFQFLAARAMRSFVALMRIPKAENPRENKLVNMPEARLISNLNLGEFADRQDMGSRIGSYLRSPEIIKIKNMADFDQAFGRVDGSVVEPWPEDAPEGVDQENYDLERKLIARMVVANRTTLKPLGAADAKGRPILIHEKIFGEEMASYHNASKFKAVTSKPDHVFRVFSDEESFGFVMGEGQWDQKAIKASGEDRVECRLIDDDDLYYAMGNKDTGFHEALVGSASSLIESGRKAARRYAYELAKTNITMHQGGGTRSIMGEFYEGAIQAWKEGHRNFLCIGHRVDVASRKEGSQKTKLREHDLHVEYGSHGTQYMAFGKDCFHTLTHDHMPERKHAIIAPAHVVTAFIGGAGTEDEYYPAMYHNLMVAVRGHGIFPGFDNTQQKRIHFVNSKVKNGAKEEYGFYNALKDSMTPRQWELLNVHFYDTEELALEARNKYAADLGYDIHLPRDQINQKPDLRAEL